MARARIRTVAIIGGGPSGGLLATLLARAGLKVAVFTKGTRPALLIGESLVPAIVPFLRELGIEEEVRSFGTFKPGATWSLDPNDVLSFKFSEVRKARTTYSYNVPRDLFDEAVLRAAVRAGAQAFRHTVVLERVAERRLRLGQGAIAATEGFLEREPDLIVDATGRARMISRLLDLPFERGDRQDTALFAHRTGVPLCFPGNVHTDRLERGWAWRIPLPGRVSVGIVVDSDHLRTFGDTIEEQYEGFLRADRMTGMWAPASTRLTPVMKYSNYQLASTEGVGEGWALVGDAFGFIDPVFSSGLLIAMDAARELARAVLVGTDDALKRYERHVRRHLRAWRRAVGYYYDGRLFTLLKVGEAARKTFLGRLAAPHFNTHFPRVFTGEATTKRYSLGLLAFMCEHSLGDRDPRTLRVN